MKLGEAIEILKTVSDYNEGSHRIAIKLGIEALKKLQRMRRSYSLVNLLPLPGEDK